LRTGNQRRPEQRADQRRIENRKSEETGAELETEETSSDKNEKTKRERRGTSEVASSGRRYFRLIVIEIVKELSNKQLRLIQNPRLFVTEPRTRDNNMYRLLQ
jgi:hypothetical protein